VTRSQIDKIGENLRKTHPPDEGLLFKLQEFRATYDSTLAEVHTLVASTLAIEPTSRIKTVNTIVEKLVRSKTRLSSMQDIAGVRIVLDEQADLKSQDGAVERLREAFGSTKVDDLRKEPRHGYRAVHVIVRVNGFPVEVQVRTKLQDLWAQGMEKLADRVGRGIRYGEPPTLELFGGIPVAKLVRYGIRWSELVRLNEERFVEMRELDEDLSTAMNDVVSVEGMIREAESRLKDVGSDDAGRVDIETSLAELKRELDERREDHQHHELRARALRASMLEATTNLRTGLAEFSEAIELLSRQ